MDEHEKIIIGQFIEENWAAFLAFCDERGIDGEQAENLIAKLEQK